LRDGAGGDWAEEDDGLVLVPVVVVVVVVAIAARLRCVAACDWGGGVVVKVDADVQI
jgi:hypothetical protein